MTVATKIEDYAMIGDTQTAALISREGSLDWLCLPRFDSPACFAAMLGTPDHGRWLIAPHEQATSIRRRYRGDTLVLETEYVTPTGTVMLLDSGAQHAPSKRSSTSQRRSGRSGPTMFEGRDVPASFLATAR